MKVGRHTYGAEGIRVLHDQPVGQQPELTIGNFCSIGSDLTVLLGGNHRTDCVSTYPFHADSPLFAEKWGVEPRGTDYTHGDVTIGSDVWVGADVTILSGVTVGHGAVLGTKAVVGSNIPPYAVAVGNPARVVKYRFDGDRIQQLLDSEWWEWDDDKVRRMMHWITNPPSATMYDHMGL